MIYQGDCLEVMRGMEAGSVHAVVTDPPYELAFMGRAWDSTGIAYSVDLWREALRVLKPGGFLLAFGGTRTYHRMVVAIEDAGFVINPMLGWVYGSGFPKAADVGKGIDKRAGAEREVVGTRKQRANDPGTSSAPMNASAGEVETITTPATPAAVKWDGWKYSISPLKPALEPVCMARKPYDGAPLDSIQAHEVGAVNVKGCAVPTGDNRSRDNSRCQPDQFWAGKKRVNQIIPDDLGRFPPNLLLDPTGAEAVGRQSGELASGVMDFAKHTDHGLQGTCYGKYGSKREGKFGGDSGTAARFFPIFDHYDEPFMYEGKADFTGRESGLKGHIPCAACGDLWTDTHPGPDGKPVRCRRNVHTTVKPIALMRWLIRLVTREGQTVLDPFTGSGTTGCAAALEGRVFIGIEREPDYIAIAEARIKYWAEQPKQMPLFANQEV